MKIQFSIEIPVRRIPLETLKIDGFARRCIMHICADLDSIPRHIQINERAARLYLDRFAGFGRARDLA